MISPVAQDVSNATGAPVRLIQAIIDIDGASLEIGYHEWASIAARFQLGFIYEDALLYSLGLRLAHLSGTSPVTDELASLYGIWSIPHKNFNPELDNDEWVHRVMDRYLHLYLGHRPKIKRVFINNYRLPCSYVTVKPNRIWIHDAEILSHHKLDNSLANSIKQKVRINSRVVNFTKIEFNEGGDLFLWTTLQ